MTIRPKVTVIGSFNIDLLIRTPRMPVKGDAFNGALAVALAEGRTLSEAVNFANAAAALQVTKVGTVPAMPYRRDVERLLQETARTPSQSYPV